MKTTEVCISWPREELSYLPCCGLLSSWLRFYLLTQHIEKEGSQSTGSYWSLNQATVRKNAAFLTLDPSFVPNLLKLFRFKISPPSSTFFLLPKTANEEEELTFFHVHLHAVVHLILILDMAKLLRSKACAWTQTGDKNSAPLTPEDGMELWSIWQWQHVVNSPQLSFWSICCLYSREGHKEQSA